MSHVAYIAIERAHNKDEQHFDLHYSHFGAANINQTRKLLSEHRSDLLTNRLSALSTLNSPAVAHVEDMMQDLGANDESDVVKKASDELIEPEPAVTDIPKRLLGNHITLTDTEAFFTVEAQRPIQTYIPIWCHGNVVEPLVNHTDLKIYRAGTLEYNTDTEQMHGGLLYETTAGEVTPNEIATKTVLRRTLKDVHENIYATIGKHQNEVDGRDATAVEHALRTPSYDILINVSDPIDTWAPRQYGNGLFIKHTDAHTRREIELNAAALRFDPSMRTFTPRREITETDRLHSHTEVLFDMVNEFDNQISHETPYPIVEVAREIQASTNNYADLFQKVADHIDSETNTSGEDIA